MDPLNDFEFKPLTEGLGFHRKSTTLAKDMKSSNVVKSSLNKDLPTAPPSFKTNLPSRAPQKPSSQEIDKLVETFKHPQLDFQENKSAVETKKIQSSTNTQNSIVPTSWHFAPFIVDFMMVVAMFLFAFVVSITVTQVDIYDFFQNIEASIENSLTIPAILGTMLFCYLSLCRIFTNATLGEYVFDLQLGSPSNIKHYSYSFKVIARIILIASSGLIVFPILSLVLKKDLAGLMTGLCLHKRNQN